MLLKKVLMRGGIAFVVFFVAFRPGLAVDVLKALGGTFVSIFVEVGSFFGSLVS
jgi:hypothetical protein